MASHPTLAAYPERLVYKFYNNTQAQVTELAAGNLDAMATIPAADFLKFKADAKFSEKYALYTQPTTTNSCLTLNLRNPKLSDKKVRQAMAHAVNVDDIIKNIISGMALRMNTIVLPSKAYNRKDLAPIPYNVERAKQLLAEAGWKDSNNNGTVDKMIAGKLTELQLSFLIYNKAPTPDVAVMIQNNLKAIGIGVEIVTKDFNIAKEEVKKFNFEMAYTATGGTPSLDDFEQKWHSTKGSNETGFGTPKLDALLEQISSTLDAAPRNALYGELQQIIYDEQPVIMLINSIERIAISKRFANAKPIAIKPYFFEHTFK
jgi:peptide/nickel transport system substrate-binding protein